MIYDVQFAPLASKTMAKYKKSNPDLFKKLNKLLLEIQEHPRTGKGHPEPLKGGNDVTYSRHITAKDRIIYDIYDDVVTVLVLDVEGHYNDK